MSSHDSEVIFLCLSIRVIHVLSVINEIVETGEYTIEGIAAYTQIPLDIIIDAACGISNQFSVAPWARVVDLYMQVKPDVSKIFFEKLIETMEKENFRISALLREA